MAICEDCNLEMHEATTCFADEFIIRGERFARTRQVRVGARGRCGDCGIQRGGFHHYGCDMEPCPRCRRQLLSCGCGTDPTDEDVVDILAVADNVVVYPDSLRGLAVPSGRFPFRDLDPGDHPGPGNPLTAPES